jgi:hypothetical protein
MLQQKTNHHLELNPASTHAIKERFEKLTDMYMALWWNPEYHVPTCDETFGRLNHININGASPFAFSFKTKFTSEGVSMP